MGLFWDDQAVKPKRARTMPFIPDTKWTPPRDFPNLSTAKAISFDVETYDPELTTYGPGWARNRGHLVGVSIGVDGGKWYFPIRHEIEPHVNMEPQKVIAWLKDTLNTPHIYKIGANLLYDIGWLRQEGVTVSGKLFDVQFAEALLVEGGKVALEHLAQKYLNEGKDSDLLYRWCADFYGGAVDGGQRANIYRSPARLVGPYAESDADLPLRLAGILYRELERENLLNVMDLECRLIPLLIDMRFAGVSVDVDAAERARIELLRQADDCSAKIRHMVGFDINVNASDSLAKAFDQIGLKYPCTEKGAPSFQKLFLENVDHELGKIIVEERTFRKMAGTFIEGYILGANINGKVYGQFHPLKGDGGGTRSGRFSSSMPNLQNLPSRDKILAPLVRGMFVPDRGHVAWRKYDYSQIEYRFLVHFALGKGADEVRQRFIDDPTTDYHKLTQSLVKEKTGIRLDRKPIKNINFGLIYGMGVAKLTRQIGLSKEEGSRLFTAYHEGAPFAKATMDYYSALAQDTGIIETILGRKSRFNMWESTKWHADTIPLPYAKAIHKWGGSIRRAGTHKALNRLLQGSAADMMKVAMVRCYEDGIFNETGIPRLTVHDELDFSDPGGKDEAFKEMQRTMETALPLKIPVQADGEIGPNWGTLKDL